MEVISAPRAKHGIAPKMYFLLILQEASKQLTVTKERWKKKLEGEEYKPPPKTPLKPKEKPKR